MVLPKKAKACSRKILQFTHAESSANLLALALMLGFAGVVVVGFLSLAKFLVRPIFSSAEEVGEGESAALELVADSDSASEREV